MRWSGRLLVGLLCSLPPTAGDEVARWASHLLGSGSEDGQLTEPQVYQLKGAADDDGRWLEAVRAMSEQLPTKLKNVIVLEGSPSAW